MPGRRDNSAVPVMASSTLNGMEPIDPMRLCIVIVLYNCKISNSKTILSLINNFHENPKIFANVRVIIYDNSLICQDIEIVIPFLFTYFHDPSNKGLAAAYNYALNEAIIDSCSWLLLFDQDSQVAKDFIQRLIIDIATIQDVNSVKAVVPIVRHGDCFFSPSKVLFGGMLRPINMKFRGIYESKIFAIGSGSVIRVSFLTRIDGFNKIFWMDSLDRWLFHTIETSGGKVFVSDSIIDHELSVMDYNKLMNINRYSNIMKYESLFMRDYKTKTENYYYYLRLLKRSILLFFTATNRVYSKMTFLHLIDLLFFRSR